MNASPEAGTSPEPAAPQVEPDLPRDALHILPLEIVPLESPALRRARLVKTTRLESMVELYADAGGGRGHVRPDQLGSALGWPADQPDLEVISRLAVLPSYDVYALRVQLRQLGIVVDDADALRLSPAKSAELTDYMRDFTRPLMQQVYGADAANIEDLSDLIAMFANPDRGEAMRNLMLLARRLEIGVTEVPRFLEDYGDIFLSLAYYKATLDQVIPRVSDCLWALNELRGHYQLRSDRTLMQACQYISMSLSDVTSSLTGRFESFHNHTRHLWNNITAERFREVKKLITAHHTTVGGVLCGLSVKMRAWDEQFPNNRGGPFRRAEFVLAELKPGIDAILDIERQAPTVQGLD
ncbi:MAG: hypothetical protein RIM84_06405 [Alphaproteobacteria bacterium]